MRNGNRKPISERILTRHYFVRECLACGETLEARRPEVPHYYHETCEKVIASRKK